MSRKPYPSDISEEEWHFVAPYLTLMDANAPQRRHDLREVFNALRWLARAGALWRLLPHDLPPWQMVYQQFRRLDESGCFEAMVNDMRSVIRISEGRRGQPSAVILDGRTLQSSCESGVRAGYDGYKSRWRQQGAHGRRHAGVVDRDDSHVRRRAGARAGQGAVRGGAGGHRRDGQAGVGGSGLNRRRQDAQAGEIDCRSANCPKRGRGLSCCPDAGWSSAVSGGCRAFDGSIVISSACWVLARLHFAVFAILMLPKAAAVMAAAGSS